MSLLNLNNDPPNGVSQTNMNLSDMYAGQGISSRAVPMFDRDQGKIIMTSFDFSGNFEKANEYLKKRVFPFSKKGKAGGMLYSDYMALPQEEKDAMLRGVVDNVVSSLGNLRSEYRVGTSGVGKVRESSGGLPMYNNIMNEVAKLGDEGKRYARAFRNRTDLFNNKTDDLIVKIRERFGDEGLQKVVNNVPDLKMYIDLVRGARKESN